jgi:hypothetical protein
MRKDSTPAASLTPRIVTPNYIRTLEETARERTFGFVISDRDRQICLHGYLLALEEVMKG